MLDLPLCALSLKDAGVELAPLQADKGGSRPGNRTSSCKTVVTLVRLLIPGGCGGGS